MALKYVVTLVMVSILCIQTLDAFTLTKRASADGTTEEKEVCQGRTPCGWAIYNRMSRHIEYFMRNKCECNADRKCLTDDDDISISAYVYRCKIEDNVKRTS